jgi:peptidoglycan/LPS O-acetylase OafA/YrhL
LAFSASLAHGFVPLQDNSVALFAIPSVLMVLGAAAADLGSRRAPPRPLVYLGDASYTLYLIHFGFITAAFLAFRHLGLGGSDLFAPEAIVTGAAAGVAACLIYRYVEKPMLDSLRRRFIPSQLAAPAGATDTVATPLSTKDGL